MADKKGIGQALEATDGDPKLVDQLIEKGIERIKATLPKHLTASRVIMLYKSMLTKDPKLSKCTAHSLVGAMMIGVELGLEPIANQCAIIPYKNKYSGKLEANFQIMYGGVKDLYYRSDFAGTIAAHAVKEKDVFTIDYGDTVKPIVHHPLTTGERGKTIGYYSQAKLKEGGVTACYMTYAEVLAHAKQHSKSYDAKEGTFSGPWATDFDSMGNKTVMLQHSKFLPTSATLQKAFAADEMTTDFNEAAASQLDTPAKPFTEEQKKKAEAVEVKAEPVSDEPLEEKEPKAKPEKKDEPKADPKAAGAPDISAMGIKTDIPIKEMVAEVVGVNVRQVFSKKLSKDIDISEYKVEDDKNFGVIQMWGKHEIAAGQIIKFKSIERGMFQDKPQFTAKEWEAVK